MRKKKRKREEAEGTQEGSPFTETHL